MKNLKNKIIIGTAQLDNKYGIFKDRKKITKKNIKEIFENLKKENYLFIDTFSDYKNSEKLLQNINLKKFKIIGKIGILRNKKNIYKFLKKKILNSLKKLKINNFEGFLIHDEKDLCCSKSNEIYDALISMKNIGYIKKIGISMYNFDKVIEIVKNFKIDIIQLPYNLLDRRLENKELQNILKAKKVQIYVRSIFLQGLLLSEKSKIPPQFQKYQNLFDKIDNFCIRNDTNKLELCLKFVTNKNFIDKIIIGIDDKKNIFDINKIKINKMNYRLPNIFSIDKKLIDPRKWRFN